MDVGKTAITTPFGVFEFCRTNFGHHQKCDPLNAAGDILVTSESQEEHFANLDARFKRLTQYGLVSNKGIAPLSENVETIFGMLRPLAYKGLRRLTEMVNL